MGSHADDALVRSVLDVRGIVGLEVESLGNGSQHLCPAVKPHEFHKTPQMDCGFQGQANHREAKLLGLAAQGVKLRLDLAGARSTSLSKGCRLVLRIHE